MALGHDLETAVGATLNQHCASRRVLSVATNRQGAALEYLIAARLRADSSPEALVKAVNLVEGIQDIRLESDEPERA
jgi:hypothetical protein